MVDREKCEKKGDHPSISHFDYRLFKPNGLNPCPRADGMTVPVAKDACPAVEVGPS